MKKYFTLAALALALVAVPANAQVQFGLKGGLNYSNTTFGGADLDAENKAGFFIGPTVKLSLPITGLSFDAAALYDQRSFKGKIEEDNVEFKTNTLKQQSIQIPINVRYGVGLGSVASVFAFAGPQFGFNVGDDKVTVYDYGAYKENLKWKKSNFSVNVGVGVSLLKHLQATVNYNIACGKTGETEGELARGGFENIRSHNHAWQVGVAYYF